MDITFRCPKCVQDIIIDEAGAGLTVQCPGCKQSVQVPAHSALKQESPQPGYNRAEDLGRSEVWTDQQNRAAVARRQSEKEAEKHHQAHAPALEAQQHAFESEHQPEALVESLDPKVLAEFTGQTEVIARLRIAVEAAKKRGTTPEHILLVGGDGSGKSALARLIAREITSKLVELPGRDVRRAGDLAGVLTKLETDGVWLVHDIGRIPEAVVAYLVPALTTCSLEFTIDQGPNARNVRLQLPRFTMLATVERIGEVDSDFLSCFTTVETLAEYSTDELMQITKRFAERLKTTAEPDAYRFLAEKSDGTPRNCLYLLKRVRDYALVKAGGDRLTTTVVKDALDALGLPLVEEVRTDSRVAIPREVRLDVWRRDRGKCARCGSRERLEFDHIVPVSKGGSNTARNIELLCETCNRSKADKLL